MVITDPDPDPATESYAQEAAVEAAPSLVGEQAIPALLALVSPESNSRPSLLSSAIEALATFTSNTTVQDEFVRLLNSTKEDVRFWAAKALHRHAGEPSIWAALIRVLSDPNEEQEVKEQAMYALELEITHPEVRDALAQFLNWESVVEALAGAEPTAELRDKLGELITGARYGRYYALGIGWSTVYPIACAAYDTLMQWARAEGADARGVAQTDAEEKNPTA